VGLTRRKQLFVAEYLADPKLNTTQAVIRAGFSEKRAKVTASELLKDPEIKAAIEHQRTKKWEAVTVNEKYVVSRALYRGRLRCMANRGRSKSIRNAWAISKDVYRPGRGRTR
jgi:phage terminase small subunit